MHADASGPPIPILLLTGYLGAGKTTLLNHLLGLDALRQGRLALVINEFGPVGVDGKLVRPGDWTTFEINRGSLFCACTTAELLTVFSDIAARLRPERVVVEATGIAETGDVEALLATRDLAGRFAVRANVCIIDAANFTKVVGFMRAARVQAQSADAIVINKADLAGPGERAAVEKLLDELNPTAPRTVVSHGQVSWEFLAGLTHRPAPERLADGPPPEIAAASIRRDAPVDRDAFLAGVAGLGESLLRLKGHVDFGAGPRFVEAVGANLCEGEPRPGLPETTAVTVIARGLTSEQLRRHFETALRPG